MPETVLVIANPAASGFRGSDFRQVCHILGSRFSVEEHWPESKPTTHALALEAASRGVAAVFAMGGDGVAHHVAHGLVGSNVPLGIIPSGTTNVLARLLDLPRSPVAAAKHHLKATPVSMPAIRAEMTIKDDQVLVSHALFALGFGFDADVVELAESAGHRKRTLGGAHYALSTVRQLWGYRRKRPHGLVEIADTSVDSVAAMVQVHDLYTYFGRIRLKAGPPSDGSLTVATYTRLGPTIIPRLAVGAVTGSRMEDVPGVQVFTDVDRLAIAAIGPPLHAQADGEPLGEIRSVRISHVGQAYRVLA